MTTLYRPVLIESAEQAEALPDGIVVVEVETKTGDWVWASVSEVFNADRINVFDHEYHIALVPIEAEEETHTFWRSSEGTLIPSYGGEIVPGLTVNHTRLVTPWDPADRMKA